ncbi:MAG: GntR family transcriptional regulator [Burkholderiales bacterium]
MPADSAPDGLAAQAYETLRASLVAGDLAPGEPLQEIRLARRLGMSRTPVREALRVLARDGFVEANAARGYAVPRGSVEDLRELFELRESLEGLAARCAAMRATDAEIAALEAVCREYDRAKGIDAWTRIGTEFHRRIVAAARNRRMARTLDALNAQIVIARRSVLSGGETRHDAAMRAHRAIQGAIVARSPDAAESAARDHVRASYESALSTLQAGLAPVTGPVARRTPHRRKAR